MCVCNLTVQHVRPECIYCSYVDTVFALQKQKLTDDEQNIYRNEARRKGEVDVELPKHFKDLSTVHTPIGGLFESPKVRKQRN